MELRRVFTTGEIFRVPDVDAEGVTGGETLGGTDEEQFAARADVEDGICVGVLRRY